jgi:hypothetical protein
MVHSMTTQTWGTPKAHRMECSFRALATARLERNI